MNRKITIGLGFCILVLITIAILTGFGGSDMRYQTALGDFPKLIELEKFDNLSLTIYYMNPFILTRAPLSVNDLVYGITAVNESPREKNDANGLYEQKIVINGSQLKEHVDLLSRIGSVNLMPIEEKSYLNARIYYVFETEEDGKLLDVVLWGGYDDNSIYVNGIEVEGNNIFYDIIIPFLPEVSVKDLSNYLLGVWPK